MKIKTLFIVLCLIPLTFSSAQTARDDALAKRIYESGMAFYNSGKYEDAMKDFDSVISSYPQSKWAALSLYQKGYYQFSVLRDYSQSITLFNQLVASFPSNPKSADALYYVGIAQLKQSQSKLELNDAISTLERVIRIYPNMQISAAAAYNLADIYHQRGETTKALQKIKIVDDRFKNTDFYLDSQLLKGIVMAEEGEYAEAARQLQKVVDINKDVDKSNEAKDCLNAIQRLYLDSVYSYKMDSTFYLDRSILFDEPVSIFLSSADEIYVFDSAAIKVYRTDMNGKLIEAKIITSGANTFFVDKSGTYFINDKSNNLLLGDIGSITLSFTADDTTISINEPVKILTDSYNNIYILDKSRENIFRFDSSGTFNTRLTKREFEEIITFAIDNFDKIYVIDGDSESILIFNQTGKDAASIAYKGQNYQLEEPVLLKFDRFNNLYVYDKDLKTILIFDQKQRLMKKIPIQLPIESVKDFVVTGSSEILILDDEVNTIYKLH